MKAAVKIFFILIISFGLVTGANAESDDFSQLRARLKKDMGAEPTSITKTPVEGLYEVTIPPRVFYASKDGRYVINGNMFDLETKINLTSAMATKARIISLDQMGESTMIVFAPKKVKHTVSVFTDIDCGYCRKLHNEMDKYNKLGIKIRYLAWPRAGVGSGSFNKAVSVWCAEDRNEAMTAAKKGSKIENKKCDNPVAAHFQLGQELGVTGTPALMLENGQIYPGYVPADKLIGVLDQIKMGLAKK